MSEAEVYASMTDIFRDVFLSDEITLTPDMTADDIAGWDSHKQIEIILTVQERFGVKMSTKEIDKLANVGGLVHLVMAKTGGSDL